jgi:hypothetical protein
MVIQHSEYTNTTKLYTLKFYSVCELCLNKTIIKEVNKKDPLKQIVISILFIIDSVSQQVNTNSNFI